MGEVIRVLAWMEAMSVTGPAKNLFAFARGSRELTPSIVHFLGTFRRQGDPANDAFQEAAAKAGVACHVVIEKRAGDLGAAKSMRDWTRQVNPTVVQTHNNKSHFLLRWSGLHHDYPWVAFHHGYTQTSFRQRIYNLTDRWSLRAARRVVTVTEAFVPELRASGVDRERIDVIPNAIVPPVQVARHPDDPPVILSVGRLSKEKGHLDLIRAAAGLPCRVVLVGDGPERETLRRKAQELGVDLEFAGQVGDVSPYYRRASVFVLPSHSEGSPNVLLEAMAEGLPIVAARVGGIPETVRDRLDALLVDAGDVGSLSSSVTALLAQPELAEALAQSARQRVLREFTPEARARKLAGVYRCVLAGISPR